MKWDPEDNDEVIFPKLHKYLKNDFCAEVKKNKVVWKAFRKYSTLSDEEADEALEFGKTLPVLVIGDVGANGAFKPSQPKKIFIDLEVAEAFEARPIKLKKVMQSTILHEMVHWGRHNDGDPKTSAGKYNETKSRKFKGAEVGKMFECTAYGGDIGLNREKYTQTFRRKNIRGGARYRKFECPTRRLRGK